MRSVIIDGPDSWSQTLQDEGLIENFVGLDFADAETVYERCLTVISDIKQVRRKEFDQADPEAEASQVYACYFGWAWRHQRECSPKRSPGVAVAVDWVSLECCLPDIATVKLAGRLSTSLGQGLCHTDCNAP